MKKAKKVINVFTGHTLEEYKSLYDIDKYIHIDKETINKFYKKHPKAKKNVLLDGRSWWLIDDTYYEIDRRVSNSNGVKKVKKNNAAIKIALAGILGGVGIGGVGTGTYFIIKQAYDNAPDPGPTPTGEISLSKTSDTLDIFKSDKITVNNLPSGATVTWSSEDTSIATVDNEGSIKGHKTGSTNIVATIVINNNATKILKCLVTIKMPTEPTVDETIKYHYIEQTANESEHYEVYCSNYSSFKLDYLALPSKYSGKDDEGNDHGELPVTGFYYNSSSYQGAFSYCSKIKSVVIPEGFTSISNSAFDRCENLEDITIPNSVTAIGDWCFTNTKIKSLTLSENVKTFGSAFYGNEDGCLEYVDLSKTKVTKLSAQTFMYCGSLKTVKLNNLITNIPKGCFYGCSALENFELPDTVTSIDEDAFANCSSLKSISLGESFEKMAFNPFSGCTNLVAFNVNENNPYFKTCEDKKCLMDMNKTLYSYPSASGIISISNEISSVAQYAFARSNVKEITFNSNITNIDEYMHFQVVLY